MTDEAPMALCTSGIRAGGGTRTPNRLFTRQVRYQLRHASTPGRERRGRAKA